MDKEEGRASPIRICLRYNEYQIVVLSGRHTGGLKVRELSTAAGPRLRVTGLERTLIDVTVRPVYAGAVERVLDAYDRARKSVSVSRLIGTWQELDHVRL